MAVSFEHDFQYGHLPSFLVVPFVIHPWYLVILSPLGAGAGQQLGLFLRVDHGADIVSSKFSQP